MDERPIGMLDSGVGGLSILREVQYQLSNENILYFADRAHVPYGPRPAEEIREFASSITRFFLERDAKVVVLACNAASAASLHFLRESFPDIPFVGMEPAVKPAAENTRKGIIGVITTAATYQGELFASVVDRFAADIDVKTQVCPEFVELVEAGQLDTPEVWAAVRMRLAPLLESGIDQLVLGCTHFPFLIPVIQKVAGGSVMIVDPSSAVARQVGRVMADHRNAIDHTGTITYYTSGDPDSFARLAAQLLDRPVKVKEVVPVTWEGNEITIVC
nr:glutamate racemase [Anaerolineae bacterium]